jgi:cytochrome c oxidase assembly factor CtaG
VENGGVGVTFAAAQTVPEPGWAHVLSAWTLQPQLLIPVLAAGWLYIVGVRKIARRYPRAPWPRARTAWFLSGLAVLLVSLMSPIDVYAEVFLWVHMIQHLLLISVVPPLLLLGAPVTLLLRASSAATRRRRILPVLRSAPVKFISHPVVAWSLFAAAMVVTHFSPLYEAALEHPWVHSLEHLIYLTAGLLFWWPVVGLDPSPWRMGHPVRLLYVFLAGPVNTFTALAIYSAGTVLYAHYAQVPRSWGPSPLTDQHWGGALMWIVGDLMLLTAVILVALDWMRHDTAEAARIDARLDAEAARREQAGTA